MNRANRNCLNCGRRLVAVGSERKNGKYHSDWATRAYHKKCWRKMKELQMYIRELQTDKDECLFVEI